MLDTEPLRVALPLLGLLRSLLALGEAVVELWAKELPLIPEGRSDAFWNGAAENVLLGPVARPCVLPGGTFPFVFNNERGKVERASSRPCSVISQVYVSKVSVTYRDIVGTMQNRLSIPQWDVNDTSAWCSVL